MPWREAKPTASSSSCLFCQIHKFNVSATCQNEAKAGACFMTTIEAFLVGDSTENAQNGLFYRLIDTDLFAVSNKTVLGFRLATY